MKLYCRTLLLLAPVLTAPVLAADPVAPAAACGYISAAIKPPLSEEQYPAEIRRIDGEDMPKRPANRYRLTVGEHAIAVQEKIGSTPRGYTKLRKLGNREVALVYKIIKIEVQANTSYQIGAQLYPDKLDPKQPNAYWDPVVWRTQPGQCR